GPNFRPVRAEVSMLARLMSSIKGHVERSSAPGRHFDNKVSRAWDSPGNLVRAVHLFNGHGCSAHFGGQDADTRELPVKRLTRCRVQGWILKDGISKRMAIKPQP